jgi:hypothetical protein
MPCPLQISSFGNTHHAEGGDGARSAGPKKWGGGGEGGHGLSRAEAEIWSIRVQRGEWGSELASLILHAH